MRLLWCTSCGDVLKPVPEIRTCRCTECRCRLVNTIDIGYHGPAAFLSISQNEESTLSNHEGYLGRIRRMELPSAFLHKTNAKDVGAKWGRARSRARRGRASADGDTTQIHTSVRMEWQR